MQLRDAEERAAHWEGRARGLERQLLALERDVIDDREALLAAQRNVARLEDCRLAFKYAAAPGCGLSRLSNIRGAAAGYSSCSHLRPLNIGSRLCFAAR